jgi:hypothetical protein
MAWMTVVAPMLSEDRIEARRMVLRYRLLCCTTHVHGLLATRYRLPRPGSWGELSFQTHARQAM